MIIKYAVSPSRGTFDEWRVEAIDERTGECFVTIFSGPNAKGRALEYADIKENEPPFWVPTAEDEAEVERLLNEPTTWPAPMREHEAEFVDNEIERLLARKVWRRAGRSLRPYAVSWDGHLIRFTDQGSAEAFANAIRAEGYPSTIVYMTRGREDEAYFVIKEVL